MRSALLASLLSAAFFLDVGEAGKAHNVVDDPQWHQATATWYGSADGDGSDGKPFVSTPYPIAVDVVTLTSLVKSSRLKSMPV